MEMPRLSGLQALAQIRQRWPELPVVLMSGNAEEEVRPGFAGYERVVFLPKPFIGPDLADALERARGRS